MLLLSEQKMALQQVISRLSSPAESVKEALHSLNSAKLITESESKFYLTPKGGGLANQYWRLTDQKIEEALWEMTPDERGNLKSALTAIIKQDGA